MRKQIRVMVVDDSVRIRRLLKTTLQKDPLLEVVASVADGASALEKINALDLDVVVLDIVMPRMDGITCLEEIRTDKNLKQTVVFILTTSKDQEDKIKAYNHNVTGYIIKSEVADGFIKTLQMLNYYFNVVELPDQ